jgi:hypothetical protein
MRTSLADGLGGDLDDHQLAAGRRHLALEVGLLVDLDDPLVHALALAQAALLRLLGALVRPQAAAGHDCRRRRA